LPENHNCPKLDVARATRQQEVNAVSKPSTYEYKVTFGMPRQAKGRVYFSPKELKHLAIAALLIIAVGLLTVLYNGTPLQASLPVSVVAFTAILAMSFFIHEIAHKITAQRKGLWSEFRLTVWGSVMTLIFAFLPIKLISPGAVMIAGAAEKKDIGRISIAGPSTNIALSIIFFGISLIPSPYVPFFLFGGFFNAYLAAFNLVPFGVLDGLKIFNWNKAVWGLAFAASAALTVIGFITYSQYL
jgi:Zn-dependent protease